MPVSYILSASPFQWSLSLEGKIDVPFREEEWTSLVVVVCTLTSCVSVNVYSLLKVTPQMGTDLHLSMGTEIRVNILILCPFSKIKVIGSPLGPMSSPATCSWISSCRVVLKSNQKAIGYPRNIHTIAASMCISSRTVVIIPHVIHSWVSTLMTFLPQKPAQHRLILLKPTNKQGRSY